MKLKKLFLCLIWIHQPNNIDVSLHSSVLVSSFLIRNQISRLKEMAAYTQVSNDLIPFFTSIRAVSLPTKQWTAHQQEVQSLFCKESYVFKTPNATNHHCKRLCEIVPPEVKVRAKVMPNSSQKPKQAPWAATFQRLKVMSSSRQVRHWRMQPLLKTSSTQLCRLKPLQSTNMRRSPSCRNLLLKNKNISATQKNNSAPQSKHKRKHQQNLRLSPQQHP